MSGKMRLDLSLGFGQKTQIPAIVQFARHHADRQCAHIPERIQEAFTPPQLFDAPLSPGQMLVFFFRRLFQRQCARGQTSIRMGRIIGLRLVRR